MLRPLVISKLQLLALEEIPTRVLSVTQIHLLKHKLLYYSTQGIRVNTYEHWGAIQYFYIYRYNLYTD